MRNQTKILIAVLLIALSLRLWGIDFGLPYLYHPDEPNKIEMAQRMFKTGDLNPHWFIKPSVLIYLNAILYLPYYAVGKLLGTFNSSADIQPPTMLTMAVGITDSPATVLMGRLLTASFGVLGVFLVYQVGKKFCNEKVGILAAVMMAISPTNVVNSRFITVNTMLTATILLVALFSYHIYKKGDLRFYLFAGTAIGIAISMKYPGAIAGILLLFGHFLRTGLAGLKDRKIYLAISIIPIAFLVGTPYALFDFPTFSAHVFSEFNHYTTGHTGMEGNSLIWYSKFALRVEGLVNLFALYGIVYGVVKKNKHLILLASFNLVYFAFISFFKVRNDRTFLPLTPFIFIFGAYGWFFLKDRLPKARGNFLGAGMVLVLVLNLGYQGYLTTKRTISMIIPDSRETGAIWIEENLPAGSKVALEPYSPYIDPGRYEVVGMGPIIDHDPQWYVENSYDYLVFSGGMYGRFFSEPEKYPGEVANYERFFNQFELIRYFTDGNIKVRVYRVPDGD